MAGLVKAQRRPLMARSWAVQGGRTRRDLVVAWSESASAGWERELTSRAHVSERGQIEGMNQRRKCILRNMPKAHTGQAVR
jgi:hypothetical protein